MKWIHEWEEFAAGGRKDQQRKRLIRIGCEGEPSTPPLSPWYHVTRRAAKGSATA